MRKLGEIVRVKQAEGEALGIIVSQEEGDGYGIHLFEPNHYASDGVHFGGILGKPERAPSEEKGNPVPESANASMTHAELDALAKDTNAQNYPQKGDKEQKAAALRGTS